jgi:hypothetical protein
MSKFFDSEQVRESLDEITELQNIIQNSLLTDFVDFWQKEEQIENLEELFERQKLMYIRLKLSDDPEAKKMVEKMQMSCKDLGMPKGTTVEQLFDQMQTTMANLRRALDNSR